MAPPSFKQTIIISHHLTGLDTGFLTFLWYKCWSSDTDRCVPKSDRALKLCEALLFLGLNYFFSWEARGRSRTHCKDGVCSESPGGSNCWCPHILQKRDSLLQHLIIHPCAVCFTSVLISFIKRFMDAVTFSLSSTCRKLLSNRKDCIHFLRRKVNSYSLSHDIRSRTSVGLLQVTKYFW